MSAKYCKLPGNYKAFNWNNIMKKSNAAALLQETGISNVGIYLPPETQRLYKKIVGEIGSTQYGSEAFNQTVIHSLAIELLYEEVCIKKQRPFKESPYGYFKKRFLAEKSLLGREPIKGKKLPSDTQIKSGRKRLLEELDEKWEGELYKKLKRRGRIKPKPTKVR